MKHESPRIRRLRSDHHALEELRSESTIFDFHAAGHPAERYTVTFRGNGLWRPTNRGSIFDRANRIRADHGVAIRTEHQVRIELGASYPRMMPGLSWLTPIFHPNISSGGVVCLGEYGTHWVPSLDLAELCHMLWDMIRYKNFDVDSPYNRDAATWARDQVTYQFPVDSRPIRDKRASPDRLNPPALTTGSEVRHGEIPEVMILDDDAPVIDAEIIDDTNSDEDIVFLD